MNATDTELEWPRVKLPRANSHPLTETVTAPVVGMSCAACANNVERALSRVPGVQSAAVNFANQSALVTFDPKAVSLDAARKAVQAVGYDVLFGVRSDDQSLEERRLREYEALRTRTIAAFVLAVPVVVLAMVIGDAWRFTPVLEMTLTAPIVFWLGKQFFVNAWRQAKLRTANMDTLVALSTGIAFLFSALNTLFPSLLRNDSAVGDMSAMQSPIYFESAAVVVAFILLGKLLEHRAKGKTSSALKKLIGLQPATARVIRDNTEQDISLAQVRSGDIISLRPGERVPVDGTVQTGRTYIDESMLTGEPVAIEKSENSRVFAGTINQRGHITILAGAVGNTTLLAQIVKRVEQAQGSKAPVEQLVDKVAGVFVPIVIAIALLSFAAWLIFGGALYHAVLAAVTVLIIACPCALGLATPTAIIASMGKAAENGILIRDAASLEITHTVSTLVMDKTGTITEGKPSVHSTRWYCEQNDELTAILRSLEARSEHPLANAVVSYLPAGAPVNPLAFESMTGRGVMGVVKGVTYFVGSHRLLSEKGPAHHPDTNQSGVNTSIYFFTPDTLIAELSIGDAIKPGSKEAIAGLTAGGVRVVMLTGDSQSAAAAVAKEVGMSDYHSELLPHQKSDYIKQLQTSGEIVAMVGDGINDSESLAQADVGIAMGHGTDIAMEAAHMTIISSDLRQLPKAFQLSRATVRTVKQNLFWAFVYNVIGIPIAAGLLYPFTGFLLNPMIAGAAMALSSVSVVSNSLRLKRLKLSQ